MTLLNTIPSLIIAVAHHIFIVENLNEPTKIHLEIDKIIPENSFNLVGIRLHIVPHLLDFILID
jgi:hypothetical protein